MAVGSLNLGPLLQVTRTVPIVFTIVPDPVGAGFVDSLARPGRNATGFTQFEYSLSAKWLELLKDIAPSITRAAVLREPGLTPRSPSLRSSSRWRPRRVEVVPLNVLDAVRSSRPSRPSRGPRRADRDIEPATALHRELIIGLAAQHKLPAVYFQRFFVEGGGLISYGPDFVDQFRLAAGYVDRILKGEKPADLPVQAPTRYELAINLKTAKALNLEVPPLLLVRAEGVIE